MLNTLSEKDNEIEELKQELKQQREESNKKLQEMQQPLAKIERNQSHLARWTLFIIVVLLISALGSAYALLTQETLSESVAAINETTKSYWV